MDVKQKKTRKKKNVWGRPTKMTEDVVKKLESIFQIDWTVWEACSYVWISRETYYNREAQDKDFLYRMTKAKDYPHILARKTLMKWLQDWDTKAAIEYLKRRDRRYSDKWEIEVSFNPQDLLDEIKSKRS